MTPYDLTQFQYDLICNGCGAKGAKIRPPRHEFFRVCCDYHDLDYYVGWTEEHRREADLKLKQKMFAIVNRNFSGWFNRRRYYTWCRAYYLAVRWFGKKHFQFGGGPQSLP